MRVLARKSITQDLLNHCIYIFDHPLKSEAINLLVVWTPINEENNTLHPPSVDRINPLRRPKAIPNKLTSQIFLLEASLMSTKTSNNLYKLHWKAITKSWNQSNQPNISISPPKITYVTQTTLITFTTKTRWSTMSTMKYQHNTYSSKQPSMNDKLNEAMVNNMISRWIAMIILNHIPAAYELVVLHLLSLCT